MQPPNNQYGAGFFIQENGGRAVNDYMPLHVFERGEPRGLGSLRMRI